jgi:hypothetical protein
VAEKLGLTLNELQERMTPEELQLWVMYLELKAEEEKKAMEKSARRGR